jgi:hypothetical protein
MSVVYLHIYLWIYIYIWYNKKYYISITITNIYLFDPWINKFRTKKINATCKEVPHRPWMENMATVSPAETKHFF